MTTPVPPPVDGPTAPALVWMNTRWAWAVAAVFIAITLSSLPTYAQELPGLPWRVLAVLLVGVGFAGLLATRADPMPLWSALGVAACAPVGAIVTALALPGPLSSINQANVLGAGVALCAFLGVRGRIGVAWTAQAATLLTFAAWGVSTGQGMLTGVTLVLPNLAVMLMATVFAGIVRPAAREIRAAHAEARKISEELASYLEDRAERARQTERLHDVAWPSLVRIASGEPLTESEVADARLAEAQLRDAVLAPTLYVADVIAAARAARARGVRVTLLDGGGLTDAPDDVVSRLCAVAVETLKAALDGEVTVRVLPSGRRPRATIVAVAADGAMRYQHIDAD